MPTSERLFTRMTPAALLESIQRGTKWKKDEAEWATSKEAVASLIGQGKLAVSPFSPYLEPGRETEDFFP